jgi:hypothetical protein
MELIVCRLDWRTSAGRPSAGQLFLDRPFDKWKVFGLRFWGGGATIDFYNPL